MITPRRRVASVSLVFAVTLAACGSSKPATRSTTTQPSRSTTSSPATTSTIRPGALSVAIWPTATSGVRYHDPVSAARSFATDYLHFVDPDVGEFRQGDAHSGEVPIRATVEGKASGPETTVIVRDLAVDGSWWVLGSATPNIVLTEPAALTTIRSPVRLRGTSTAFEATVQVSIRQDDIDKPLVESFLMGGSNGQMGPFDATFTFPAPTSAYGAIVLSTISPATGHVAEATAVRVGLAPTTASATPEAAIRDYLTARGHVYAGECSKTSVPADVGKYCSILETSSGATRTYLVGPVASEGDTVVVTRQDGSWRVTSVTPTPPLAP